MLVSIYSTRVSQCTIQYEYWMLCRAEDLIKYIFRQVRHWLNSAVAIFKVPPACCLNRPIQNKLSWFTCNIRCVWSTRGHLTYCIVNGYKICKTCVHEVRQFPSCRQHFVNDRNLALEDLAEQVKYPCKYRSYGCTETFDHDTIGRHQEICLHIPQKRPFAKLAIRKCSWAGSYNDMEKHLKEIHLEL
jgi:hypothetical protein